MSIDKLKHKEITGLILKSFYEIYNELGNGFLESVYENAMAVVLHQYGLNTETQRDITVYFRRHIVGNFRADIIVDDNVIVELKAVKSLDLIHEAQVLNYLRATNIEVGLLLNFGRKPTFKRLAYDNKRKENRVYPCQSAAQKEDVSRRLTQMNADKLTNKEITNIILKSFYEVYNELGSGFLESVYKNAMEIVLQQYGLNIETQKELPVYFRGSIAGNVQTDILVCNKIILKVNAARRIDLSHEAQLLNYLKATGLEIGLLLNFGRTPEFKRLVYTTKE